MVALSCSVAETRRRHLDKVKKLCRPGKQRKTPCQVSFPLVYKSNYVMIL